MKYWINTADRNNKLIVITEQVLYLHNPTEKRLQEYKEELFLGKIPARLTGIPFSSMRKIDFESGKQVMEVYYNKKDKQKVRLPNFEIREQIQTALEEVAAPYRKRRNIQKTFLEQSYGYLGMAGVIAFITILSYGIAVEMEQGVEYISGGLGNIPIFIATHAGKYGALFLGLALIALIALRIYLIVRQKRSYDRFEY